MQFEALIGQTLISVAAHVSSASTMPVGYTNSQPPGLWSGPVDLLITARSVQIQPCEVPEEGRYPSLGVQVAESSVGSASPNIDDTNFFLPARIYDVRQWDSLGERPVSAIDLILAEGTTLTIRHV